MIMIMIMVMMLMLIMIMIMLMIMIMITDTFFCSPPHSYRLMPGFNIIIKITEQASIEIHLKSLKE